MKYNIEIKGKEKPKFSLKLMWNKDYSLKSLDVSCCKWVINAAYQSYHANRSYLPAWYYITKFYDKSSYWETKFIFKII